MYNLNFLNIIKSVMGSNKVTAQLRTIMGQLAFHVMSARLMSDIKATRKQQFAIKKQICIEQINCKIKFLPHAKIYS